MENLLKGLGYESNRFPFVMRFQFSLSFVLLALSFVHAEPISIVVKSSQGLRLLSPQSCRRGRPVLSLRENERLELMRSRIKFVTLLLGR